MKPVITISSAELFLKKKNHYSLSLSFIESIRERLNKLKIKVTIQKDNNTILISSFDQSRKSEIVNSLKMMPGINFIRYGYRYKEDTSINKVIDSLKNLSFDTNKEFMVVVKSDIKKLERTEKEEMIHLIASHFISNLNWKVNLSSKSTTELQFKKTKKGVYFYFEKEKGLGGFFQDQKKDVVICLLSGGIDSILATLMMAYRGCSIITLSFSLEENEAFKKKLNKINKSLGEIVRINKEIMFNIEEIKTELFHIKEKNYRMVLLKRIFIKVTNLVAKEIGGEAIVTGDSLNQVASQTLSAIACIDDVADIPIIRPLIGFTKEEIASKMLSISPKLFDLGRENVLELCEQFHPSTVITRPKIEKIKHIEEKHFLLNSLIDLTIKKNIS